MIGRYVTSIVCYEKYCLEKAYLILLVIPIFFILMFYMYKDFVKFKTKEEKERFRKRKKWLRLWVLITSTAIVLMLLFALSNPFTTEVVTTHGDPVIKLLVDSSESMDIFDSDLLDTIKEKLSGNVVEMSQISSGKRSELGEGILKKIEGGDNLLILTDGNNNFGKGLTDIGIYSRISDTRLLFLTLRL